MSPDHDSVGELCARTCLRVTPGLDGLNRLPKSRQELRTAHGDEHVLGIGTAVFDQPPSGAGGTLSLQGRLRRVLVERALEIALGRELQGLLISP